MECPVNFQISAGAFPFATNSDSSKANDLSVFFTEVDQAIKSFQVANGLQLAPLFKLSNWCSWYPDDAQQRMQSPSAFASSLWDSGSRALAGKTSSQSGTSVQKRSTEGSTPHDHPSLSMDLACVTKKGYAPGYKECNQDTVFAYPRFHPTRLGRPVHGADEVVHSVSGGGASQLWGVFDGHGGQGHKVSSFIRENLPAICCKLMTKKSEEQDTPSAIKVLEEAIPLVDRMALDSRRFDVQNSGSTAVVCMLQGHTLTTAWVGDSRAIMGYPSDRKTVSSDTTALRAAPPTPASPLVASIANNNPFAGFKLPWATPSAPPQPSPHTSPTGPHWSFMELSFDHKPEAEMERARVVACGGRVKKADGSGQGPYRVWMAKSDEGGLAMSRAVGDLTLRPYGVVADADSTQIELPKTVPSIVVLASDGVWEFMENQEVIDIVSAPGASAAESCAALVAEANKRWVDTYYGGYIDDITALVVKFEPKEL
eukprot:gene5902-33473_t